LKIFIHTWNIFSNGISWREVNVDTNAVTNFHIYNYFNDLKHLIHHIIIDDDTKIELIGNVEGNISNGPMPILGWKNYWYGKFKIIDYLFHQDTTDENEPIINCRFDIFNNSNSSIHNLKNDVLNEEMLALIKGFTDEVLNKIETPITKNVFLFDYEKYGIDNIYFGNIHTMHQLISTFFYHLDDILSSHTDTKHQEFLVYRMNRQLFDS
jgi:hypothetical protein